ncbi:MAG: glycosyltransferase family 4 protein [Anaerolineae bacterium]|nr:glycosyltransferase family 4 protein [Anaerolineae bacterium]
MRTNYAIEPPSRQELQDSEIFESDHLHGKDLHIGLITPDLSMRHGWAQYSLSLVKSLHKAGVRITVVSAWNSSILEDVDIHPILPALVRREKGFRLKQLAQISNVRRLLRDCDVIHVLAEPYALLGAAVAGKRPLLITGHGSFVRMAEHERWPFSVFYRRAFMQSTMVCVSHYTAKVAQQALSGLRTVVVNNGVDAARFASIEHSQNTHEPMLLAVGAVKGRKGQLELVRAMPKVLEKFPDAACMIVGSLDNEPDYVRQVQDMIAAKSLGNQVHLIGRVPEETLLDYYRRADVFVMPSMNDGWKFEGYGLVHLEASAAGLPVIGTTDCGAEDAIDDGVTGLLVSQSQVAEELPAAIIRLLGDPELAARMGAAGRLKAQQRTWDVVAGEMLAVYNQAVQN